MPQITVDINQDAYDALSDVASHLGWTPEELAGELIEDTFESDTQTAAFMELAFAWPAGAAPNPNPCSGPCGGKGVGYTFVAGACPGQPNAADKAATEKKAKVLARQAANAKCMVHGADCLCTGGQNNIRHSNNKTATDASGNPTCRYRASAYYTGGTCTVTP